MPFWLRGPPVLECAEKFTHGVLGRGVCTAVLDFQDLTCRPAYSPPDYWLVFLGRGYAQFCWTLLNFLRESEVCWKFYICGIQVEISVSRDWVSFCLELPRVCISHASCLINRSGGLEVFMSEMIASV